MLAKAYIADQPFEGVVSLNEGLEKGSVFTNLQKPYVTNLPPITATNPRTKQLRLLQSLAFFVHDLGLYLDIHPDNMDALKEFNSYNISLNQETKKYENLYGPLSVDSLSNNQYPYRWIEDPWPWEFGN